MSTPKLDDMAKEEYCKIIGTAQWPYAYNPTHFYKLWESFLNRGCRRKYPWDKRKYPQQKEADMLMCKFIHSLYKSVAGLNVVQLEIEWK